MKKLRVLAVGVMILLSTGAMAQGKKVKTHKKINKTTITKQTMTKTEQVKALLKSIETRDSTPISYINPKKYIQHNQGVRDGLDGFVELLNQLPKGSARVRTVRAFEDGNYVFAHTDYDFFGSKTAFDVFRFEDGKIVEHWDNLQQTPEQTNPSGHSMIDGSAELRDLEKTEENKTLVASFVRDVLIGEHPEKITDYIDGENYIQHNPNIADGLSGLQAAFSGEMGATDITTKLHKVLGQGNFVLAISEGTYAGKPAAYYDLFRVEGGKLVEHWDVIEAVLPEADAKNSNGKFGF